MALAKWFGQALLGQFSGTAARRVDWANDTIKVALLKSTYEPNQDTQDFFNDVSAHEAAGTGYTAGGETLANAAVAYNAATNTLRLEADDTEWTEISITARYAVVYKDDGEDSESPVLAYVDFTGDETVASGTFKIEWDVDGVMRVVAE